MAPGLGLPCVFAAAQRVATAPSAVRSIYFDYNATTPLDAAVRDEMLPLLGDLFGNPSSIHHVGRRARALLDATRERVAQRWKCAPGEVVFTSGGTESNNLAILGTARALKDRGRHLIASAVEHHAVLHPCQHLARHEGFELTLLPVDGHGVVSPEDLRRTLRPDTILASVMAANNEVGTIEPVAELGRLCRERGVLFHTDAVQWLGKLPFESIHQFEADLVSVCAHKFHGPKGAGALFVRSGLRPQPVLHGGAHEDERRAGTENLAAVVGLAAASDRFLSPPVFPAESLQTLTAGLAASLRSIDGVTILGDERRRLPNTVSFVVDGADSTALLAALDLDGVCASSGSACSAGSLEPSHVVTAMGFPRAAANSLVRFSLGRESTAEEVALVAGLLPLLIRRAQHG